MPTEVPKPQEARVLVPTLTQRLLQELEEPPGTSSSLLQFGPGEPECPCMAPLTPLLEWSITAVTDVLL